ncbi:uncharacterized protein UHOD_00528 [Ustilago sp. UG-2017b]|nr:uncharacterized protein UHOD_00528 [Ustilago sp. UG-2017b]
MSQPVNSSAAPSATLDVARGRANTGASLSAAPYGTSYRSTTGSSVVSNGSLLDLYARSPSSVPSSVGAEGAFANTATDPTSSPMQSTASASSPNGISITPATCGFQTPSRAEVSSTAGFSIPPSDSNASVWTTASASSAASTSDSIPQSKRASMAGFDIDAMRSIRPAHDTNIPKPAAFELHHPSHIGVEAPNDDSDGSHYDEEEMPGGLSHDSFDRSADKTVEAATPRNDAAEIDDEQAKEVFSNALPSPPVPRRTSSVMQDSFTISPSPSLTEDLVRVDPSLARHAASRSGSGQLSSDMIPQRRSSTDFREDVMRRQASKEPLQATQEPSAGSTPVPAAESVPDTATRGYISPAKGTTLYPVDENARLSNEKTGDGSKSSHEPSIEEQKRLERELLAEADESRPRTLKEARERAKLRKQQGDSVSPSASATSPPGATQTTLSPSKGASLHMRDVASSATAAFADDNNSRSSIDSKDRPLRNPKRISNREGALTAERRSMSERSAPSDYSHDSGAEGAFTYDEGAVQSNQQQSSNMDVLTDAVDNAMNDLSFGSADETLSAEDELTTPLPPQTQPREGSRPPIPASLPSARSLASVTGVQQTRAQDAFRFSPLASPVRQTPQTPKDNFFPSSLSGQPLATPPITSPVHQRAGQDPITPQRSTTLPPRIEVYGKTVPLPKAFASSNIVVDKKRMSSWERARTYAQYTNELLHLETGLNLWMEVVQRPAMRQQNNRAAPGKQGDDWLTQGTLPRSTHVRNEGSYADSIRSDMTFPMRGDGAKAKEIVSVMPTMVESPVRTPVNLPYPGVVSQQQQQQPQPQPRSNSTQTFSSISGSTLPMSTSATDSLSGTGNTSRSSGMGGGNRFFGGLGRKHSKRTQPSAPISNAPAPSHFSSAATAARGSRAYLANNRNKSAASADLPGVPSGSLPAARPSIDTFETSYSSHSRPESPATGPTRITGLGIGSSSGDASLGQLASASTGRLNSVQEHRSEGGKSMTSPAAITTSVSTASTSSTTGLRAPLGPRAPNMGSTNAGSSYDMKRTDSNQTQTGTITPVTPITPNTGGFGSGPTFVSRLGGGSFSSSGGAHAPRSPGREGYSSPDFLHAPRRTSDLTGTSPTSPQSSGQDRSFRIGGGLRSSLSYGSVRERMRSGSSPGPDDEAFQQALTKLGDVLPDADTQTLRYYLKKAKGNDLAAIGDYLQDQSLAKLPKS